LLLQLLRRLPFSDGAGGPQLLITGLPFEDVARGRNGRRVLRGCKHGRLVDAEGGRHEGSLDGGSRFLRASQ